MNIIIKNDLQRSNLKGNVSLIELFSYEVKTILWNTQKGQLSLKRTYRYNDIGNLFEELWHDANGQLSKKANYNFDSQGNLIEEILQEKIITKVQTKYDEKGNRVEVKRLPPMESLTSIATYKYDNMGNVSEERWFDVNGFVKSITTFIYDERGNMIEKNSYFGDGSFKEKIVFKYSDYDKFGNWLNQMFLRDEKLSGIGERRIY